MCLNYREMRVKFFDDIADYSDDGRLTEPSDGKLYDLRNMINFREAVGRILTEEEMGSFRI